jgi:hypothetical protein
MLVESYLTPKGYKKLAELANQAHDGSISQGMHKQAEKAIRAKYTKNRYTINPESVVIKSITHVVPIQGNLAPLKEVETPKSAPVEEPKKKNRLLKAVSSLLGIVISLVGVIMLAIRMRS